MDKKLRYFLLWLEKNGYLKKPVNTRTTVDLFNIKYKNKIKNRDVGDYVKKDCPNCPTIHTVIKTTNGYKCPSCLVEFK